MDILFFNFQSQNDLDKNDVFNPIQEYIITKEIFGLFWNVDLS